jgi:hypothetical protein
MEKNGRYGNCLTVKKSWFDRCGFSALSIRHKKASDMDLGRELDDGTAFLLKPIEGLKASL